MQVARTRKEPPEKGGWNLFHSWLRAAGVVNPAVHLGVAGDGQRAWYGWPDVPQLEKLVTGWVRATDQTKRKLLADENPKGGPSANYRLKSFCGSACPAFAHRVLSRVSTLWAFATLSSSVAEYDAAIARGCLCSSLLADLVFRARPSGRGNSRTASTLSQGGRPRPAHPGTKPLPRRSLIFSYSTAT
jgi:hypothetical protein